MKRINSLIRQEVADIIQKKLNSPKIGFVSITEVDVSKDCRHATIFYSQIGSDEEKEVTFKTLKQHGKFIKGELGKVLHLKTIPDLKFEYDHSLETGVDLVNKINKLSEE